MRKISKAKDKKIKAAQRDKARAKIKDKNTQLSNKRDSLGKVNKKIERLKLAKKQLAVEITNLKSFKIEMKKSLISDSSNFVGSRQEKYDKKITDVETEVSKVVALHGNNSQVITEKINSLETKKVIWIPQSLI